MIGQFVSTFLNVVLPVFGLVMTGYLFGPRLNLEARTLARASYYIFVPAFTFDIISQASVNPGLAATMVIYILVVHLAAAGAAFSLARLMGRGPQIAAAYVLIAVFGNVGNFGLSMVKFSLGDEALAAATVYFLMINFVAFVVGVAAAKLANGGRLGTIFTIFKTPAILAFFPAAWFWISQVEVPLLLNRFANLLGAAMIPVMLVTLGVQLAEMDKPRLNIDVIAAGTVRLVIAPLIAAVLVIPFGLTGLERAAGILQSAMPPAVLTAIIAIEHDLAPKFVTTTLLFATIASLLTLTVIMSLL